MHLSVKKKKNIKTYSAQVGVGFLRVQATIVLDVLECLVHESTVAPLIALGPGAVHQILLAKRHQRARLPEQLALHGPRGAEGPARATLTLKSNATKVLGLATCLARCGNSTTHLTKGNQFLKVLNLQGPIFGTVIHCRPYHIFMHSTNILYVVSKQYNKAKTFFLLWCQVLLTELKSP